MYNQQKGAHKPAGVARQALQFINEYYPALKYSPAAQYSEYVGRLFSTVDRYSQDQVVQAAAILSPLPILVDITMDELEHRFGEQVTWLVQQIVRFRQLEWHVWPKELGRRQSEQRRTVMARAFLSTIEEPPDDHQHIEAEIKQHFQRLRKKRENLIRMHLAASADPRGILIILCDRICLTEYLCNTQYEWSNDQIMFANMSIAHYAHLADRLGVWSIKSRLEDAAFSTVNPIAYRQIEQYIDKQAVLNEKFLSYAKESIKEQLESMGIVASVVGRRKHAYSVFRKMEAKELTIDRLNDIVGVRIIVEWDSERSNFETKQEALREEVSKARAERDKLTARRKTDKQEPKATDIQSALVEKNRELDRLEAEITEFNTLILESEKKAIETCYAVLGALHDRWTPVTKFYDGNAGRDWVRRPKQNDYQSLHTTIQLHGKPVEIQIRTRHMHRVATYGSTAAHWKYKEGKSYGKGKVIHLIPSAEIAWINWLNDMSSSLESQESFDTLANYARRSSTVFVLTPMGDVVSLQKGATPLDFAYRIHTDLGHTYTGAVIGGRAVRMDYELQNGDIIELLPPRGRVGPSDEWLSSTVDSQGNKHYTYVRTNHARRKIRNWLNAHESK